MGIDEAGRGPLAGPVVIAGVVCPHDVPGVVDSKKITKEETREAVFQDIMTLQQAKTGTDMEWAVCVMDAAKIDQINILQATLEGMKAVAQTIVGVSPTVKTIHDDGKQVLTPLRIVKEASIQEEGCYVVCSDNVLAKHDTSKRSNHTFHYHALVDGNRLPKSGMPCPAEPIVKGDSKEFSIAAASILAKVTRDRLMHEYDKLYPEYNLQQHKGYPTAKHMDYVTKHGASKIHRRSFAPLRHMALDENGKIVE
jgi:ribonuclease HII